MSSETCSNCRFFTYKGESTAQFRDVDGMCRRNAPIGFTPEVSGLLFPPMNSGQWCGQYEPRTASGSTPAAPAAALAA